LEAVIVMPPPMPLPYRLKVNEVIFIAVSLTVIVTVVAGGAGAAGVDPREPPGVPPGSSFCLLHENSRQERSSSLVKFRMNKISINFTKFPLLHASRSLKAH
jgi:hypothetical protein